MKNYKILIRKILGIILIIIGIPGLVLPILQGTLLITTGLILLGNKSLLKKIKQFRNWLKNKISSS